jgi:signal transduction histidine kinase
LKRAVNYLVQFFIDHVKQGSYPIEAGLPYWRERIFNGLILVTFVFGWVAYVPNAIASVNQKLYVILIVDTLALVTINILFFNKKLALKHKITALITMAYLIALALLIFMGTYGPGFLYLSVCPFLAALLVGSREAIVTTIANIIVVLLLALGIQTKWVDTPFFETYNFFSWIAIGLNLILISAIVSIPLSIILTGLGRSINAEKTLKVELLKKNQKLKVEQKRVLKANKRKNEFIANLSHEIRTPINTILGFSDLLKQQLTDEKQKQFTVHIFNNATHIHNLSKNMVDISLIESGNFTLENIEVELKSFEHNIKAIAEALLSRKGTQNIELVFNFSPSTEQERFVTDPTRLQQILINLISNALKYTKKGNVEVACKSDGHHILFHVRDTGVGFPPDEQSKIFKRFSKIERKQEDKIKGIGLGLSITQTLTHALGGKIWFESLPGKGTTFFVKLPLER